MIVKRMNLITLIKKCLNKTKDEQYYNNRFVIRLRNNIKKYSIIKLNILLGDEHIELPNIIKYNKEYVITSDDNTDVLNFNVKLSLQDKLLKEINGFGFNTSVYKGETIIDINETLIHFTGF